ncbi:MAG: hypothetical protein ABII02_03430 [Candidatus Magasanikbacteria bacterium]
MYTQISSFLDPQGSSPRRWSLVANNRQKPKVHLVSEILRIARRLRAREIILYNGMEVLDPKIRLGLEGEYLIVHKTPGGYIPNPIQLDSDHILIVPRED